MLNVVLRETVSGSHQLPLGGGGQAEPVRLGTISQGGVEPCAVHPQEGGQGYGNVEKLHEWEVPGQSLGRPPFPAAEEVVVLEEDQKGRSQFERGFQNSQKFTDLD